MEDKQFYYHTETINKIKSKFENNSTLIILYLTHTEAPLTSSGYAPCWATCPPLRGRFWYSSPVVPGLLQSALEGWPPLELDTELLALGFGLGAGLLATAGFSAVNMQTWMEQKLQLQTGNHTDVLLAIRLAQPSGGSVYGKGIHPPPSIHTDSISSQMYITILH